MKLIYRLSKGNNKGIGRKAQNLLFLNKKGFLIPETYILPYRVYDKYIENKDQTQTLLENEISKIIKSGYSYAVRSSANIEDSGDTSYAGQFESILSVSDKNSILKTIIQIWDSIESPSVNAYHNNIGKGDKGIRMGVILQKMIVCEYSGIAFSKNPMTGLNEVIIESINGSAEQLTQAGITPERWIKKWGEWKEKPDNANTPDEIIEEIVNLVECLEKKFKHPVDIEWAFEKGKIYLLQVRKITELDIPVYSNKISKEYLPGIIKPLVWSVNISLINPAWNKLIHRIIGGEKIDPDTLSGYFYNRAYFNMGYFKKVFNKIGMPGDALELLMGVESNGPEKPKFKPSVKTMLLIPRMIVFLLSLVNIGKRTVRFIDVARNEIENLSIDNLRETDSSKILEKTEKLCDLARRTAHYNIVIPLLARLYYKSLLSYISKKTKGFEDVENIQIEFRDENNPNILLRKLNSKFFRDLESNEIGFDEIKSDKDYIDFLKKFGHFSDSGNDFSYMPWRENEELIYEMIKNYEEINTAPNKDHLEIQKSIKRKLKGRLLYKYAENYSYYRDRISSFYTYVYGLLRPLYLEIGKRMVDKDYLIDINDVFYIYKNEIENCISENNCSDFYSKVKERKHEIELAKDLSVPGIVYGNKAPPVKKHSGTVFRGVPTSHGFYMGKAKVLKGLGNMRKLEKGDVLVIPYSDVGWTPLFSKAGAVISESGGILSHSSIVAREYHIPAVVSVENACSIKDNTVVSVNGFTGEIGIIEE